MELKSSESPSGSDPGKKPKKKKTEEKKDKEDSKKKDKEKEAKKKKQKLDAEQEFDSLFGGGPRDPGEDDDDDDDGVVDSDETKPRKKPATRSRGNKDTGKTSKKEKKDETKKKSRRGKNNDELTGETTPVVDPCEPLAETQLDTPSPDHRPELRRLDPLDEEVIRAMEMADAAELRAKQQRAQAMQNSRKGLASHVLVVLGQWEKPQNLNHKS